MSANKYKGRSIILKKSLNVAESAIKRIQICIIIFFNIGPAIGPGPQQAVVITSLHVG